MPLLEEEYRKEEKINGVIYDMSPSPNYQHGIVDDYVIPDVMIICDRKHLKGGSYTGTPRFIVETLSPATALRDKTVKKELYQNAGVEEYWIISPRERAVEIYYLENGKYDLKYSYILQDDSEEEHYNADTVVTLKDFPKISMTLAEMFENVE